ncbi:GOLPH3/VPS74 family protein [Amycolatopsis magusensis]|uniref:GOLPH3/VPS74 family protein n=1 Tax=Amycolatopsis magusensis TaxID=882444 RepID=UPI003C2E38F4
MTAPLADDLFFLAHDDRTGKRRLNERDAGFGLAGAVLAELLLAGRVTVEHGRVRVLDPRLPRCEVLGPALKDMVAEPESRVVRDWLRYLGRTAYESVARRLLGSGQLRVVKSRLPWRPDTYEPVDINAAAWPAARLSGPIARLDPVDTLDVVLAGLVIATGLDRYVFYTASPDARQYLERLVIELPAPLRVLVLETETAVGDAVLHHRM